MLNPTAFVPEEFAAAEAAGKCSCGVIEGGGFGACKCGTLSGAGRQHKKSNSFEDKAFCFNRRQKPVIRLLPSY